MQNLNKLISRVNNIKLEWMIVYTNKILNKESYRYIKMVNNYCI